MSPRPHHVPLRNHKKTARGNVGFVGNNVCVTYKVLPALETRN